MRGRDITQMTDCQLDEQVDRLRYSIQEDTEEIQNLLEYKAESVQRLLAIRREQYQRSIKNDGAEALADT